MILVKTRDKFYNNKFLTIVKAFKIKFFDFVKL